MAGCGATTSSPRAGDRTITAAPPSSSAPVVVTTVDRAAYDAELAKLKGKIVLVDFWATWCTPCVEQLPHTLELSHKLADRGFKVVTVSCDDPDAALQVGAFLTAQHAESSTNLISQYGGSGQTMVEFEIEGGAVPFYKLYDRTGNVRQTFGLTAPGDIEAAVQRLLAE
jgi:thiol-disulfide isomerase/thioredoxin